MKELDPIDGKLLMNLVIFIFIMLGISMENSL